MKPLIYAALKYWIYIGISNLNHFKILITIALIPMIPEETSVYFDVLVEHMEIRKVIMYEIDFGLWDNIIDTPVRELDPYTTNTPILAIMFRYWEEKA